MGASIRRKKCAFIGEGQQSHKVVKCAGTPMSYTTERLPGVVGTIDGTHIPIKVPIENPNDYINRKFPLCSV